FDDAATAPASGSVIALVSVEPTAVACWPTLRRSLLHCFAALELSRSICSNWALLPVSRTRRTPTVSALATIRRLPPRSRPQGDVVDGAQHRELRLLLTHRLHAPACARGQQRLQRWQPLAARAGGNRPCQPHVPVVLVQRDRKSTRLNSSHVKISYAVFCLKKKKEIHK